MGGTNDSLVSEDDGVEQDWARESESFTKFRELMQKLSDKKQRVVDLELPGDYTQGERSHQDWINLLIDSIFNVLGESYCVVSWVKDYPIINVRSGKLPARKEIAGLIEGFQNIFREKFLGKFPKMISVNGVPLEKIPVDGPQIPDEFDVAVSLQSEGATIGFLALISIGNGRVPKSQRELLRHSAFEITSALRMLWELMVRERNRLESIIQGMIDGIVLINENGDVLYANPSARSFLGLPQRRQIRLENLNEAHHLNIVSMIQESILKQLDVQNKIRKVDAIGKILGINIQKVMDRNGVRLGWIVILRDITDSWEMDRLRKEFVADVSHNLHSPLTALTEGIYLLLDETMGPISEKQKRFLRIMRENVEKMDRMISHLLEITRLEIQDNQLERRRQVNMNVLLQKTIATYQWIADKKRIRIRGDVPSEEIILLADRDQISQVFNNLLDNSIKFTPEGGTIWIGMKKEGKGVLCWVKDNGIGIPKPEQTAIFEKFHRVDNAFNTRIKGYGLGLSIAQEIIENYRGKIWVESDVGKGSVFWFQFPIGR